MNIEIEDRGGICFVRVRELKLTYPRLASFYADVQRLVEGGALKVILDLSAVTYVDSASIGCLMDIHRLLKEKGGKLRLAGLQARVETMLSMTGVHRLIDVYRDEAAAVAAFSARKPKERRDA
jgi:anti-sigma B factor antagonist